MWELLRQRFPGASIGAHGSDGGPLDLLTGTYGACTVAAIYGTPMDVASMEPAALQDEFRRIARDYAPCDVVLADIEAGTPDDRVRAAVDMCQQLSGELNGCGG